MIIAFSLLSMGIWAWDCFPPYWKTAGLVEYGETTRFSGLPDSNDRWMIVPVLFCYHGRRFVHQVYHIGIGG